ncbi:Ger(x)C family spore germination protein [Paenibacillus sp. FSL E2-0201]|uniref:Ger(x)C family spore germination protein n=1 Tax=Paenibacillus sp. FSL E2-0201 TaxID=2954726 RepID=UPI0030DAF594
MKRKIAIFLTLLLFLTGCWDQRELKNIRMVHTAGIDMLDEGKIRLTVSIPTIKSPIEPQGNVITPKISGEGHSVQEASSELQRIVSQHMDLRETRVLLINEKFAKNNLYEALDFFFREADFPINVLLAITESPAQEVVQLNVEDRSLLSEYLHDLLGASEQQGNIPKDSPFLVPSIMLTPGVDNALPLVIISEEKNRAKISGLALLHGKQMTGRLNESQAKVYVMMKDKKSHGTITERIGFRNSYVTFSFERTKQRVRLTTAENEISADIHITLKCALLDNPTGEPLSKDMIQKMAHNLEDLLTIRAKETIKLLQEANCDGIGIGLEVRAHLNDRWKSVDWNQEYPKITINPHFKVKIYNHGLLI